MATTTFEYDTGFRGDPRPPPKEPGLWGYYAVIAAIVLSYLFVFHIQPAYQKHMAESRLAQMVAKAETQLHGYGRTTNDVVLAQAPDAIQDGIVTNISPVIRWGDGKPTGQLLTNIWVFANSNVVNIIPVY